MRLIHEDPTREAFVCRQLRMLSHSVTDNFTAQTKNSITLLGYQLGYTSMTAYIDVLSPSSLKRLVHMLVRVILSNVSVLAAQLALILKIRGFHLKTSNS